ncbi:hypothetical protein D3C78_1617620 [compost metagenome]
MNLAVLPNLLQQPLYIGRLKLRKLTVIQDERNDVVIRRKLLQHIGIGGVACLGLLPCRKLQLLK